MKLPGIETGRRFAIGLLAGPVLLAVGALIVSAVDGAVDLTSASVEKGKVDVNVDKFGDADATPKELAPKMFADPTKYPLNVYYAAAVGGGLGYAIFGKK